MKTYLKNLIDEKDGMNIETTLTVEGPSGANVIPLGCLVETILQAPANEQSAIRKTLVKLDFMNRDVMHYFAHLAQAIAV